MPLNNCEGDLTGVDYEQLDPSTSADLLSRAAGGCTSTSLYPYIDQSKSFCLNATPSGIGAIVRPIHTRNELSPEASLVTHGDTGPEMIVHLVFNQPVRARTIVLNVGRGDQAPGLARVWTNRTNALSFDQLDLLKPDQEWQLETESDSAVEYPTRVSRFQSVSSLSFDFRDPSAGQRSRIYFLGVLGDVKQLRRDPSSQLTVGAENSADATLDPVREHSGGNQTTIRWPHALRKKKDAASKLPKKTNDVTKIDSREDLI